MGPKSEISKHLVSCFWINRFVLLAESAITLKSQQ